MFLRRLNSAHPARASGPMLGFRLNCWDASGCRQAVSLPARCKLPGSEAAMAPEPVPNKESRPFALTISSRTPASRTNHSQSGYRHIRLGIAIVVLFVPARACQAQRRKQTKKQKQATPRRKYRDRHRDTRFFPAVDILTFQRNSPSCRKATQH